MIAVTHHTASAYLSMTDAFGVFGTRFGLFLAVLLLGLLLLWWLGPLEPGSNCSS